MEVKLGDICTFQSGGTPSKGNAEFFNGTIPWITTVALNGGSIGIQDAVDWITDEAIAKSAAKVVPANSIMVGTRVGVGKVAINDVEMSTSQDIISLLNIDENRWDKTYLCKFLQGKSAYLNSRARGATIKGIKIDVLAGLSLEEIPVTEQKKIAEIIDKVNRIIVARRQELQKLDELIKARFVEMFGDPENNPRGWDTRTIGDVITKIEAGWSGNGIQREKAEGEIAVLKVSAVTKGYFVPRECKVLDDQDNIKKMVCPENGDLIFSRANTRELVGATAIIDKDYPEYILSDKLWKIQFNDLVNVYYMKAVLSSTSIRSKFSESSTGTSGSMFNVSMEKFKSIRIPIAPIEFQNQYRDFVCAIDKSKAAVQKSLDETQMLFDSLMQKYFG